MHCPEKEDLQRHCSATWDAFESALPSLGVTLDPTVGAVLPRLMQAFQKVPWNLIDPRAGMLQSPYLETLALLREHQTASARLSRHLHNHRC